MSTPVDEVQVVATSAQAEATPSFRVRIMLLREDLRSRHVSLLPEPLFQKRHAAAFYGAGPAARTRALIQARRRLGQRLSALAFETSVALIQRQVDLLWSLRLERLAAAGRRLVWDVDDAIWHDTRFSQGHALAFLKGTARKVRWLASRADHVIVANRLLAEHLSSFTSRLSIVPSLVETRGLPVRCHGETGRLVLGWIGSPGTAPYLERLRGPLQSLARELGGRRVELHVVGGDPPRLDASVDVRAVPWSPDAERAALERMDIGLMPLPDNVWTRGKSAYKATQYMAAGVPVIGDDVGIAAETILDGAGGYVVGNDAEWLPALMALARDPGLRARLGQTGRQRIEEHYSVERWAPVVADILRGESVSRRQP